MKRRDFLKQSAVAAAFSLPAVKAVAATQRKLERNGAAKKVIIIGAGLAGLSAAYELTQANHDVRILEARNRPGGRVETLRSPFADGLYVEAGAMNVFDSHHWTMKYIKEFNLTLDPIVDSKLDSLLCIRGQRLQIRQGQSAAYPLDLHADEKTLSRSELWKKYVGPVLEQLGTARDWPPDSLKKYDQMTFFEFLRRQGASEDAAALLSLAGNCAIGDGARSVSAVVLLREAANRAAVKQNHTIRGGTERLPQAFASRLHGKIHYGAPVIRIEHDAQRVRVVFLHSGKRTSLEADRLICTMPFSLLRHLDISPRFSPEKQRAIEQLGYTSVARAYLQTRKKFWLDEGLSGSANTDQGNMLVFDGAPTPAASRVRRGILEAYLYSSHAREVTTLKEGERIATVLNAIEKIHPRIRQNFELGITKCWDEDEWSRGAYAWYKPGEMSSLMPHVARAEGRIHFAGEHASSLFGWMQGAFESGNRAAQEVNEAG